MAANKFIITGSPKSIHRYEDFLEMEENNTYVDLLFYPDEFNKNPEKVLPQKKKTYRNVSFKDTTFNKVSFVDCTFDGCLLLSTQFNSCEFIDCKFIDTNTNKSIFINTLIDPAYFKGNFDLKNDANIAANLYHALYKNLSNERQPDRAKESLYLMHRSENANLNYKLKEKKIRIDQFLLKKSGHLFDNLTSGYGLKLYRVFLTFSFMVLIFSGINYYFREDLFDHGQICSVIDSIYFTLVTLTTLGYGDISPSTQAGKLLIAGEATVGIVVISLFLTSISSRVTRS